MAIDHDRLVQIATELKNLEQSRENLLAELRRIAGGISGVPVAPRRGRPPKSASLAAVATPSATAPKTRRSGGRRKRGLTTSVLELLSRGGAYTAGEIVTALNRPKTKSGISTISTTLVRLAKEGRVKKDKERGYRAA